MLRTVLLMSFAEIVYIAKYLCQLLYHGKILLCVPELFCSDYYSAALWLDFPLFSTFFIELTLIYRQLRKCLQEIYRHFRSFTVSYFCNKT